MSGALLPCDCCVGVTRETPRPIFNRPGLAQILYRVGTHATFKAIQLSALSSADFPALAPLTARTDADFSIALLDAWSVSADILTFYQERLANECYLRTAGQPRSVFELARLVGYQPSPGVAAAAPLAFVLNDAPGAPDPTAIPAGTRVQSIPAPGQTPQTFETGTPLLARVAHNALPVISAVAADWSAITTALWLDGTATGLKPGDAILLVDGTRVGNAASNLWEFRTLASVAPDHANARTLVSWTNPLPRSFQSKAVDVAAYALRKRASLFGVNAPDPRFLTQPGTNTALSKTDWTFGHPTNAVDLDAVYPELTAASPDGSPAWVVIGLQTFRQLYTIKATADGAPVLYALSGKATRLTLDRNQYLNWLVGLTREATVFAHSEPLPIAEQPLTAWSPALPYARAPGLLAPVEGASVAVLGGTMLAQDGPVAISGKRLRLSIAPTGVGTFLPADGQDAITSVAGDTYLIDAYPPLADATGGTLAWSVLTPSGSAGILHAELSAVLLGGAVKSDPVATEAGTIGTLVKSGAATTIGLSGKLQRIYDRSTVSMNANVVEATHGETVQEILGNGDGTLANQSFTLKQPPLTYVSVAGGDGALSTLQVWVNDLLWHELPNLLGSGPADRVFAIRATGGVVVQFGDGVHGARPPTGQMNLRAVYRKGIGPAEPLSAGQISQAIDRPAGLRSVSNPAPSNGGADPDTADDARQSAPLHVLTLDRVVSLADYENTALAFAGIAKALATWTWFGHTRGIVVTVAGSGGAPLDGAGGQTIPNLLETYSGSGNPFVPVQVLSFQPRLFRLGASLRVDTGNFDPDLVVAAVRAALAAAFGFPARALGQSIAQSTVIAAIHSVPGVLAARLTAFRREDAPQALPLPDFLVAAAPRPGTRGVVAPAELLTLDPATLSQIGAAS